MGLKGRDAGVDCGGVDVGEWDVDGKFKGVDMWIRIGFLLVMRQVLRQCHPHLTSYMLSPCPALTTTITLLELHAAVNPAISGDNTRAFLRRGGLESAWVMASSKGWAFRTGKWGETLTALGMAMVMSTYQNDPQHLLVRRILYQFIGPN